MRTNLDPAEARKVTLELGKVPLPEVPSELRVREMEGAEAHAIRARLHMMGSGADRVERRRAAQLEVTQGLSENPTNVSVALLQADFMTNAQERLAMAEALVKARPDSGQAWGLLARCSRSINAQRRAIDLLYERQDEAERKGFTGRLALFEKVCGERAAAAAANEGEGP